jgi:ankyrin repeat protein
MDQEIMDKALRELLDRVGSVPDFTGVKFRDINDTNAFGDNALHCVCVWGDLAAAKLLIENGIDIEQKGEGGFTPLKVAEDFGQKEIVAYLISKGANTEALVAEFCFDPEENSRHIKRLQEGVVELEQKAKTECGKNA